LRVSKQGDDDYACGLFAVLTAAQHLGALDRRSGPAALLRKLPPAARARIEAQLPEVGLFEKDIRAVADAAGLAIYRPNTHDALQFRQPHWLWLAFVLVTFRSPTDETSIDRHYVLVLDYLSEHDAFVVADPHPWNPSVYCVQTAEFESAWHAAKKAPPWAASIYRA
jgi:hypothetical protein